MTAHSNQHFVKANLSASRVLAMSLSGDRESKHVRGGKKLVHFGGPVRDSPFPLVRDFGPVLAVKGSLRRATTARP
jgi:hypothetical protein